MLNKLKRAALGAHTPHDKATAASKPIPMPLPAQVRILMSQHIGAPAKALVKKGDEVFVGTKIGEAGGFVSANIHSSVSGTVAAVEPFRLSNGRMCDSVVIKTDGKQTVDPAVKAPEVTDKASFLAAVRECGLVGLGGAGFPTDVKLQPKQSVDTLLINASECEVWLTSDTQEMLENKVVLCVPEGSDKGIDSFDALAEHLKAQDILFCMGNSDVPVGQYTQKILAYYDLDEEVLAAAGVITYGSNVKEVTTQITEASVDAGVVYCTDAFSAGLTPVDEATKEMCGQVIYPAAVLKAAPNAEAAKEFLAYLQTDRAATVFEGVGFSAV